MKPLDLTATQFGRLRPQRLHAHYRARWECICECGNVLVALSCSLTRGEKLSCGCVRVFSLENEIISDPFREKILAIKRSAQSKNRARYASDIDLSRARLRESYLKHAATRVDDARRSRVKDALIPEKLEHKRAYARAKMAYDLANNPSLAAKFRLRNKVQMSLRRGVAIKGEVCELIGCTIPQYIIHIESMWRQGMTWGNYGKKGWHVDHRVALSKFDLTDPAQQKKAFHFSNTQPLWSIENLMKGTKLPQLTQETQ